MSKEQHVQYDVYSAELVLPLFEKEYPDDDRPRLAIEAAKKCLVDPSEENKRKADKCAICASHAARAASLASAASAEFAARSAADYSASFTARYSAAHAARSAARYSAAYAADSASSNISNHKEIEDKIINFGLELLLKGVR